jgi:hypothetical protein
MIEPTGPLVGVKEVTTGAGGAVTVKAVVLVPVPPAVVILIGPLVALGGTTKLISVELTTTKEVAIPLSNTDVAPK